MKKPLLTLISILIITFSFGQEKEMATKEELQKWIKLDKDKARAKTNDLVLVVVVHVKDESKVAFEKWIKDVLYDALNKSESTMKKAQLKTTRWLEPARQNKDTSWTYSWIMDPIIPKTNYDILPFLENEYGKEQAKKHWDTYLSFMAKQPQSILLKQTDK